MLSLADLLYLQKIWALHTYAVIDWDLISAENMGPSYVCKHWLRSYICREYGSFIHMQPLTALLYLQRTWPNLTFHICADIGWPLLSGENKGSDCREHAEIWKYGPCRRWMDSLSAENMDPSHMQVLTPLHVCWVWQNSYLMRIMGLSFLYRL